jgi:hypothetical protein
MPRAKSFMYACAGIFLLALSYHLGAQNARAQGPGSFRALGSNHDYGAFVEFGGSLYQATPFPCSGGPGWRNITGLGVIPASVSPSSIVCLTSIAYSNGCQNDGILLTDTGDFYKTDGITWQFMGVFPGGPTPATKETWGGVKARYR